MCSPDSVDNGIQIAKKRIVIQQDCNAFLYSCVHHFLKLMVLCSFYHSNIRHFSQQ